MTELFCRQCSDPFDVNSGARFCGNCGTPLPLTQTELCACAAALNAVHTAIVAGVLNLTNAQIASVENEHAWTRVDPAGFSIVAWFRSDDPKGGVHGIETYPLRNGGFSISSTADKQKGRRVTIETIEGLAAVLPSLLDD